MEMGRNDGLEIYLGGRISTLWRLSTRRVGGAGVRGDVLGGVREEAERAIC